MKTSRPPELDVHDLSAPLAGGTTLIEASAGTGKTYTIAAIFLRLLVEQGLGVNEILVTTFTKPATAELRDRIRRLLREAAEAMDGAETENPLLLALREREGDSAPAMAARLREAVRGFDEAAIETIHSFCQRVLTRYSFESGAAAEPELLTDERELIGQVTRDYWRQNFYECAECHAAAARIGELSVQSLAELLNDFLRQPTAEIRPAADEHTLTTAQGHLVEAMAALRQCWASARSEIEGHFLRHTSWAKSPYNKLPEMQQRLAEASVLLGTEEGSFENVEVLQLFRTSALREGTRVKQSTPSHPFFTLCDHWQDAVTNYTLAVRAHFLAWAPGEMRRRKERANLLSFNDLLERLHGELAGVRGPDLRTRIRTQYRAALVDEFQDTDPLQDGIFERLFGARPEGWLFLIGDPKQAIFGFRGGDIFTYLTAAKRADRTMTLGTNFRSSTRMVEATNAIFDIGPRAFVVEQIGFAPAQASGRADRATFAAADGHGPFRLWIWDHEETPQTTEQIEEVVAGATAGEVARLLGGGGTLGGERIVPSNLAILTSTNAQAQAMQLHLRRLGIPSALMTTSSVFVSHEAAEMLAVMQAVSRPRDEKRLRAALLTDVLGLEMASVVALTDDAAAWESWATRSHEWHEVWRKSGFIAMWRRVLRDSAARPRLLARLDGERRLTNFSHLAELLQRAATEEQLTPLTTAKWLSRRMAEKAQEEEYELRLERDDEAVRLVTVHKSKGLEYDIVFCPFAWKAVSAGRSGLLRFHEEGGQAVVDLRDPRTSPDLARAQAEKLAEEVRLLYVALTRARHRCDVAIGRFPRVPVSASNWLLQGAPPAELLAGAAAGGDWHEGLAAHYKNLPDATWRAQVAARAAQAPGAISLVPPPSGDGPRYVSPVEAQRRRTPRVFRGDLERDFALSSFTSLTHSASVDTPERFAPPWTEDVARAPVPDDIHAFPAGARTGVCLHEIFEELDFQDQRDLPALVTRKLLAGGFAVERWHGVMVACVQNALATPLPQGFALREIPKGERLIEREFHLPVDRLEPEALQRLVGDAGEGRLQFSPRRGWLKGFIDLIFRHEGRFYIVDWKSNRLGSQAAAYSAENIAASMAAHHYRLQAQLYAIALHRYLRHRLAGYDFERHFGGMIYLFVRGLDATSPGQGVWHHCPTSAEIGALDKWLSGPAQDHGTRA